MNHSRLKHNIFLVSVFIAMIHSENISLNNGLSLPNPKLILLKSDGVRGTVFCGGNAGGFFISQNGEYRETSHSVRL